VQSSNFSIVTSYLVAGPVAQSAKTAAELTININDDITNFKKIFFNLA
jgi:hypothetical protein